MSRRVFMRRAGVAGAMAAGTGYFAFAPENAPGSLKDITGRRSERPPERFRLPDFRVHKPRGMIHDIGVARGKRTADSAFFAIEQKRSLLRAALDAIGGIQHYVKPGDIVLVKPNVAFDRAPTLGATSDPEMVGELVRLLYEDARASEVRVADNPIESPADCFRTTKIGPAVEAAGGRVILPQERFIKELYTPGAELLEHWPIFASPFEGAHKVIGLAPVKDHVLCGASIGLKNWMGLLCGTRNQFHDRIHTVISDLAIVFKPTLTIIDGTRILARNGPTGGDIANIDHGDTVLAGLDPIAMDAWAFEHCLGRGENYPQYLTLAEKKGAGRVDWTGRVNEISS